MFGPHLIIDGSRCDTQKLGDRILIEQILTDYPAAIGMTKIGGPYMFEYQAPDPAYSGVSGIVVIAESHIAIHTFPALDYFTMDIFSCKNFDHETAIRYIKEALDVQEMDRMLVQRGLSFRGPHHGANGATDDLIAAAEARLAAGIVSNETVTPDEAAATRAHLTTQRAQHVAEALPQEAQAEGRMLWPQYGVTPDVGTYGAAAEERFPQPLPTRDAPATAAPSGDACEPCARGGARVVALHDTRTAPVDARGEALSATEPVQVNPTASISGLLDKLGSAGLGGRALGRALSEWERMARDPECTLVLGLSTLVVPAGLRELLVYMVEHRYVDVVVASGEDLFADLHEALGHFHYAGDGEMVVSAADRERTLRFVVEVAASLAQDQGEIVGNGRDFLRALGAALPAHAPRTGLLQAAAASGVPLYAPDLAAGPFGAALLAARASGVALHLDLLEDLSGLAGNLATLPRVGTIMAGRGIAETFIAQARVVASAAAATPAGAIYLGASRGELANADGVVAVEADPTLALPLLVSGLAQRIPGTRGLRARVRVARAEQTDERAEERALA